MAQKVKDLAVKVGSYTDQNGNEKGRYENIGAVMQGQDGNQFIMLKRTFNPAGVPNPMGKDSALISMFDPKPRQGGSSGGGYTDPNATGSQGGYASGGGAGGLDDDIPFFREDR